MKPVEFLQLAVELHRSAQPARLRTAVSRAYYAVYHEVVGFLADLGFRVDKGPGGHGDARNKLFNTNDAELARVASQMTELHRKRIAADYRLDDLDPERRAAVMRIVEEARDLLSVIGACRSEPRRTRIIRALKYGQNPTNGNRAK